MVYDIVTVPGGQQVQTMLVQLVAAKMIKKTEQDVSHEGAAGEGPRHNGDDVGNSQ